MDDVFDGSELDLDKINPEEYCAVPSREATLPTVQDPTPEPDRRTEMDIPPAQLISLHSHIVPGLVPPASVWLACKANMIPQASCKCPSSSSPFLLTTPSRGAHGYVCLPARSNHSQVPLLAPQLQLRQILFLQVSDHGWCMCQADRDLALISHRITHSPTLF